MTAEFCEITFETIKDVMDGRLGELVEKYCRNGQSYVDSIVQSFSNQDYHTLERSAHPLKSSSATLGMVGVSRVAERIEQLSTLDIRSQDEQKELEGLIGELSVLFLNAAKYLNTHL